MSKYSTKDNKRLQNLAGKPTKLCNSSNVQKYAKVVQQFPLVYIKKKVNCRSSNSWMSSPGATFNPDKGKGVTEL